MVSSMLLLSAVFVLYVAMTAWINGGMQAGSVWLLESSVVFGVFLVAAVVVAVLTSVLGGDELAYMRLLVSVACRTGLPLLVFTVLHVACWDGFLERRLGVVSVFYLLSLSLCVTSALGQIQSQSAASQPK